MAKLLPPPNTSQDVNSRQWKDWLYSIFALVNAQGGVLGTMSAQNASSVAITGGVIGGVGVSGSTINSTPIGATAPSTGAFTTLSIGTPLGIASGGTDASTASGARTNLGLGSGLSVTITTAKLTLAGANGSMTFTNGILTSQTQAT